MQIDLLKLKRYFRSLQKKGISTAEMKQKLKSVDNFVNWANKKGLLTEDKYKQLNQGIAEIRKKISSIFYRIAPETWGNRIKKWLSKVVNGPHFVSTKRRNYVRGYKNQDTSKSVFVRPWFEITPSEFDLRHYIGISMILLVMAAMGAAAYNQFFKEASTPFAFPANLTKGGRILSFQGRLTDSLGNPISTATNLKFKLYNASTGGTNLYDSTACSLTPDQDGVFDVLIGGTSYSPTPPQDVCGTEIPENIFSDWPNVYLGVTIGSDTEATPRQQIANVGYAINAETLKGFPPGTGFSNIPYINSDGNIIIATSAAGIRNSWASTNFTLSSTGTITVQSAGTGDVALTATESGNITATTGLGTTLFNVLTGNLKVGNGTPGVSQNGEDAYIEGTLEVDGTTTLDGTLTTNGIVNLGDGGDVITISGSDTNIAIIDGGVINIDGDGTPTTDLVQIGSGDTSATDGVDALQITFTADDASGNLIDLSPTFTDNDAGNNAETWNVIDVDALTVTQNDSGGAITGIVRGVNLGNLTETATGDDAITSSALNIGSGWDKILDTGALDITQAGAITGATAITSSGTITFSGLNCTANSNGGALTASGTGVLSCTDDDSGGAGATAWDDIGDPDAAAGIAMAEYAQTLDWNTADTAAAFNGLTVTLTNDASTDINTQYALVVDNLNAAGSTATEALVVIDNSDANEVVSDGILFVDAGGTFTDFIDTPSSVFKVTGLGAISGITLNTGQGAYELYAMDQNVLTTSAPTFAGLISTGNITVSSAQILGGSPLVFEGTTDDNVTTTFAFTDPTVSNKTITFTNETGTVCLNTGNCAESGIGADILDFTEFEDTLDLDANLQLNQTTYTWTQDYTGTTGNFLTYNTNTITSGNIIDLNNQESVFSGNAIDVNIASDQSDRVEKNIAAVYTNNTTEANSSGGTAFKLLESGAQGANDGTYFNNSTTFDTLNFDLATAGVDATLVIEYCSVNADTGTACDTWAAVSGTSDGTTNFTTDGKITWTDPAGSWITSVEGAASTSGKWLRIRSSTSPTTAPTAYYATISIATGNILKLASNEGTKMLLTGNGDFGLGTSSLNSIADFNTNKFELHSKSGDESDVLIRTADGGNIYMNFASSNGTLETPTLSGSTLSHRINFFGYDGADYEPFAGITASIDGTPGNNDMPGKLTFSTTIDGLASLSERMRIDNAGDVGIGITSPTSRLHVKGSSSVATVGVSNLLTADGTFDTSTGWTADAGWTIGSSVATHATGNTATLAGTSTATSTSTVYQVQFTVTVTTAGDGFTVSLGGKDSGNTYTTAGTKTTYINPSAGTGTLTFTPGSAGTFVGTIDTVTIYEITSSVADAAFESSNGTSTPVELRAGSTADNHVFLGYQAGYNQTTAGNTNTFIGSKSGQYSVSSFGNAALGYLTLSDTTTGGDNTAVGSYALLENTTGDENVAIGTQSLTNNTKGDSNVAVGPYASNAQTTGASNTALGPYSLLYNTTGSSNVAIGLSAGKLIASGNLTSPENSIYIGTDSRGFDNDDSNSIVIGYDARGLGANTTVLGNSNTTITRLWGSVGIGDSSPDALLDLDSTATTGNIFGILSTTLTTGEIADITATYAPTDGSDNEAIDINLTYTPTTSAGTFRGTDINVTEGANALANTLYGLKLTTDNSANTSTGTHSIYGGYFTATGKTAGTTTAVGLYSTASGADFNYAAIFAGGNVGIGDTTPAAALTVGDGDLFQVSGSTGDITTAGDVNVNGGNISTTASLLDIEGLVYIDDPNNEVGIGTNDPSYKLDISGTEATVAMRVIGTNDARVILTRGATTKASWIEYNTTGLTTQWLFGQPTTGSGTNFAINYWDGAADNYRMTIDTSGNIGIGDTTPIEALTLANDYDILAQGGNVITPYGGFGQYQNLLTYSEQFDNAVWTDPLGTITPTANNATGPNNLSTADSLNWTVSDSAPLRQVVTLTNSATYTFSIWARLQTDSSGGLIGVDFGDGTGGSFTATSAWQRFSVTTTAGTSDWIDIFHTGTSDFEFWGAQLEDGSTANVYANTALVSLSTAGYGLVAQGSGTHIISGGGATGDANLYLAALESGPSSLYLSEQSLGNTYGLRITYDSSDGYIGTCAAASCTDVIKLERTSPVANTLVLDAGNVGIGTTSPAGLLHVKTASIPFTATGGTITTSGGYTIHTFTSSGTFTPAGVGSVEYLVVAGGGAGGKGNTNNRGAGGGGAGGFLTATGYAVTPNAYTVTIGAGGTPVANPAVDGGNGSDSVFAPITAIGGGGGAGGGVAGNGANGGSGGGAGDNNGSFASGGVGTSGQGNNGGNNSTSGGSGGSGAGGGGSSSVGANGAINGGATSGGNGTSSSISGSAVTYAAGGGGGSYVGGASGADGTTNTGNGGGGGGGVNGAGGAGGSGIVIIRYLTNSTTTQVNSLVVNSTSGNVGIGTTAPDRKLHVLGSTYGGEANNTIAHLQNSGTSYSDVLWLQQSGEAGGTGSDFVEFHTSAGKVADIDSNGAGVVAYNAFTGSHYSWSEQPAESFIYGQVVSLTGNNKDLFENQDTSETVYGIEVTSKENDSKAFGSFFGTQGTFNRLQDVVSVAAVGNGDMWVVDSGENIQSGDYLISSSTAGHAMKNPGTHEVAYIIAKAADNVDWTTVSDEAPNGQKHKLISVLFGSFERQNTVNPLLSSSNLSIVGDITAQSFVNVSTRDLKKNISYINENDKNDFLSKIKNLKIARYDYKTDFGNSASRLGLIAEDSPIDILTQSGKGVDLYKLTTLALAGIQVQEEKIETLENKVSNIEVLLNQLGSYVKTVSGSIQAGLIEAESIVINNDLFAKKVVSPVVETEFLEVKSEARIPKLETEIITPKEKDLVIDLSNDPTSQDATLGVNKGELSKLIIKGLNDNKVAEFDSAGNATFSGTLTSAKVETSEASISGKLIAKEIESENITQILNQVEDDKLSIQDNKLLIQDSKGRLDEQGNSINDIQKFLSDLQNQPLSNVTNYQDAETMSNLNVTGDTSLYRVFISNTLTAGNILIDDNKIMSLDFELKLTALSSINLLDGQVIISKTGGLTTKGSITALAGIKTNKIEPINPNENVFVKNLETNKLQISDKYLEATTSALIITASDNFQENGIYSPAIETKSETAGIGLIKRQDEEIIVYNDSITRDSLVYLTPTVNTSDNVLSVIKKEYCIPTSPSATLGASNVCKPYFKVATAGQRTNDVKFNWLIIN